MRRAVIVLAALIAVPTEASAAENVNNGNYVVNNLCSTPDEPNVLLNSYAQGFVNGIRTALYFADKDLKVLPFCIPDKVTYGQVARVICHYLKENPAETHKGMAELTAQSLWKAWPCKAP